MPIPGTFSVNSKDDIHNDHIQERGLQEELISILLTLSF